MKTYWIMFFAGLWMGGCAPSGQQLKQEDIVCNEAETAGKTSLNFTSFSAIHEQTEQSCRVLNDYIGAKIANWKEVWLKESLSADSLNRGRAELWVSDSVFRADERYVSVCFEVYTTNGGAHGETHFYAVNYDVKNQKVLSGEEILDATRQVEIDRMLVAGFKNPEGCFNELPELAKVNAMNFNEKECCFTFDPYVLGPYSCGAAKISLSREMLGDCFLLK